jgi:hypothetical protein
VAEPLTEKEIAEYRRQVAGPVAYHPPDRKTMRWLATLDAERARREAAERERDAAKDWQTKVIADRDNVVTYMVKRAEEVRDEAIKRADEAERERDEARAAADAAHNAAIEAAAKVCYDFANEPRGARDAGIGSGARQCGILIGRLKRRPA